MIFLLLGESHYQAQKKIRELKDLFLQKKGTTLGIRDVDGKSSSSETLRAVFQEQDLFSSSQLIVIKHAVTYHPDIVFFLQKNKDYLITSPDIYIFWEQELSKEHKAFFSEIAQKIQNLSLMDATRTRSWIYGEASARNMNLSASDYAVIEEAMDRGGEWAALNAIEMMNLGGDAHNQKRKTAHNSTIFSYVDQLFANRMNGALLWVAGALRHGFVPEEIMRIILWKTKTILLVSRGPTKTLKPFVVQKAKTALQGMPEDFLIETMRGAIETESLMRKYQKRNREILEHFLLKIEQKTAFL